MNLLPKVYRLRQWAAPERWRDADKALADEVLQQLLAARASAESWGALLELFAAWSDEADIGQWVQWLEPLMSHWPAALRTSVLGQAQTRGGKSCVYRLLARLEIERIDDDSGMRLIGWSSNPDWCNLQALGLYKVETPAAQLATFLAGAGLRQLRELEMRSCSSLGGHMAQFTANPALPPLQILGMVGCDLAATDLEALAQSGLAGSLQTLDLSGNFFAVGRLMKLLEMRQFPRLECLVLNHAKLDPGQVQQWLLQHAPPALRTIKMDGHILSIPPV